MEYFFLLLSIFTSGKRNVWLRQIKVLLVVLTLANISCADRRLIKELPQPDAMCGKQKTTRIDPSCGTCGISNERDSCDFVINGTPVRPPYKYPWMVKLIFSDKYNDTHEFISKCCGSIISKNFILTAAHCVKEIEKQPDKLQILFLTDTRKVVHLVNVSAIYCHPQYKDEIFGLFDIALVRLKNKITCDKYKSPICLPRENVILPPLTHLKLAGWGDNVGGENPESPKELLEGTTQTVTCESCLGMLILNKCRTGLVYCLMGHNQSACSGDSGGPMFLPVRGKYYIEGVASYVYDEKCETSKPFVYTSVSTSRSWIREVAGI